MRAYKNTHYRYKYARPEHANTINFVFSNTTTVRRVRTTFENTRPVCLSIERNGWTLKRVTRGGLFPKNSVDGFSAESLHFFPGGGRDDD